MISAISRLVAMGSLIMMSIQRSNSQYLVAAGIGGPVTLQCTTVTDPYRVTWRYGSDIILTFYTGDIQVRYYSGYSETTHRFNTDTFSLTLNNVENGDEGVYECHTWGSSYDRDTHQLFVYLPPDVTIDISKQDIFDNETTEVHCKTSKVYPRLSVTFYIYVNDISVAQSSSDVEYEPTDHGFFYLSFAQNVTFKKVYNGALLYCSAVLSVPGRSVTVNSQVLFVEVKYPHDVSLFGCNTGSNSGIQEKKTCSLICRAENGNPVDVLSYQWYFKQKFSDGFVELQENTSQLTLKYLSYTHAGEYRCSATSAGGAANSSKTLRVIYAPVALDLDIGSTKMKTYRAEPHRNVTLSIKVHSFPNNAQFTWKKSSRNIEHTSIILGNDTTESQAVVYTGTNNQRYVVQVSNGDESMTQTFTVVVLLPKMDGDNGVRIDTGAVAGGVVATVIVVVAAAIVLFILWRARKKQLCRRNLYMTTKREKPLGADTSTYVDLNTISRIVQRAREKGSDVGNEATCSGKSNSIEAIGNRVDGNVKRDDLYFYCLIHSGCYAETYEGMYKNQPCAIKIPKDGHGVIGVVDGHWIRSQIKILSVLKPSRNVTEVLAYNIESHLCLVTRYQEHSTLKSYMMKQTNETCKTTAQQRESILQHLGYSRDIVKGMLYLAKQKEVEILHFELSARNILVGSDMTCKITNFASADDVKRRQEVCMNNHDYAIIPWMAPECILSVAEHTSASDVWSFGVLLYEIATSGKDPYPGKSGEAIGMLVLEGKCMEVPAETDHLNELMIRCWQFYAAERPDWTNLLNHITTQRRRQTNMSYYCALEIDTE